LIDALHSRELAKHPFFQYNEGEEERMIHIPFQTMQLTFKEICQGERPWTSLGNFMNSWYAYHVDQRAALISDPLPENYPPEMHQWATFCAAAVEWFCHTYDLTCPAWTSDPKYQLAQSWFFSERKKAQIFLQQTTPEEFRSRNIYCGKRAFANKYELHSSVVSSR
jgi:hypothetical protein